MESAGRHPELQEPIPERLLTNVAAWDERRNQIPGLPLPELEVADQEFKDIIDERLAPHPINIDTLNSLESLLQTRLEKSDVDGRTARGVRTRLQNVLHLVEHGIVNYGDGVRQHVIAGRLRNIRPEQGQQLQEIAYRTRGDRHEYLLDALKTLHALCTTAIPDELKKSDFSATGWRTAIRGRLFQPSDLIPTGPKREYIGTWAIDMDVVQRARAVEQVIRDSLEKKRADVG